MQRKEIQLMEKYFKGVNNIKYEGENSKNPLAYKYYNPKEMIGKRTMEDYLRFAVSYWHTFNANGSDPFGAPTMIRPWDHFEDKMELAKAKVEAAFEFMSKLGIKYFCFHDRDIAPEGSDLKETNRNLNIIVDLIKGYMKDTGIQLLWGTANLFNHPRFVHGAATSPNADVFAYAAAQVKKAIDITKELNGANYVFWGGREGYETLINTDLSIEHDNYARFLQMAVDYAKEINFTGQFLIEPKPKEPTKHQYDYDAEAVLAFLRKYSLEKYFKLNIEANHATLAYHTFEHELHYARVNHVLGSIDANQGDYLLGWDTDQFPTNIYSATFAMYEVLKKGELSPGGLNFDAKVRRSSFEPIDLFYGYIAGMDTFARGLKSAEKILRENILENFKQERYSSYESGIGRKIFKGQVNFKDLEKYALENKIIVNKSGHQEMLENIINMYI